MGLFHEFVDDKDVRLISVEAVGFGLDSGKHAATLTKGEVGVLHGAMSYLLQDDDGQIVKPHSISAGSNYPGVDPEHPYSLKQLSVLSEESITVDEKLGRILIMFTSTIQNCSMVTIIGLCLREELKDCFPLHFKNRQLFST
ncbi:uncharacterized protein J3R85_000031 [Psidium guajava]|nr:uncharacterized protein J3R85_000031 [Psidium guajava]